MRFILSSILTVFILAACASGPKYTIEDQLEKTGIPKNRASCMAGQLDERLSDDDLRELAGYMKTLGRADTPGQALDALLKIDNPRAVVAIGASGLSCALAPKS